MTGDIPKQFFAPAKINLCLHVLSKRADGYHEINSILCPIALYDTVTLTKSPYNEIRVTTDTPHVPTGMSNLAYQAASHFMGEARLAGGITIHLEKRIPVAAGLGGGSSDAATVMQGISGLYDVQLPDSELRKIGTRVGADVPFFFLKRPAVAAGIGEKLQTLNLSPPFWVLLIAPPIPVSTSWAYSQCKPNNDGPSLGALTNIDLREVGEGILRNDLEPVVTDRFPKIAEIKQVLKGLGAWGALMSGSGSTVFGIFFDEDAVEKARRQVCVDYRNRNWEVLTAKALL